jgi:hypothetical protein
MFIVHRSEVTHSQDAEDTNILATVKYKPSVHTARCFYMPTFTGDDSSLREPVLVDARLYIFDDRSFVCMQNRPELEASSIHSLYVLTQIRTSVDPRVHAYACLKGSCTWG